MYKSHINFSVNINMSHKKSISINPSYFKIGGKREKKQKKKKPTFKNTLKPNDVKKKLIAKIKAHQKKEKDKEILEKDEQENSFKNEFEETLSYLENMKKKKEKKKREKKEKRRNKTMKKKGNVSVDVAPIKSDINVDLEPMKMTNDPPYGCLKGGSKPTWRQYNKTLKKNKQDINDEYTDIKPKLFSIDSKFEGRADKLDQLKDKFKSMNKPFKPKKTKIKTKRIRRKITLGKNRKQGIVGILVKSKRTRKNVKREVDVLKRKSIEEVKSYLRKHNLTKIGSNAPDHILRTTFENAYLSGDINNNNPDILLHNWHKDEDI
tara:strand:+ start:19 stop:981 length:963 start_codon:yes stop_codon:yes gene_type:complete